jgi:cytochrome c oxidase cbb3-type subunit III
MKISRLIHVLQIGVALLPLKAAWAQQAPGSAGGRRPDAAAVERGGQIYRSNCGFCHGLDARGAAGPDLARSLVVLEDVDGQKLGAFLKTGRPDAGMPAFAGLSPQQSADVATFLHARIDESRARTPMDVNAIVVGNATEGAAFFAGAGKCRGCHNPDTDFKGISAKYDPFVLQARIINPRGGLGAGPIRPSTVRVTLPSGETLTGRLVAVDDFSLTLIDGSGVRRSLSRDNEIPEVQITDPYQAHMDNLTKITDKQMHDLTAYLVTLK